MRCQPANWDVIYRPRLGSRLEGAAVMPLTNSDTPGVVEAMRTSSLEFSGAVLLAFEGAEALHLTWEQVTDCDFGLLPVDLAARWGRFSLDVVHLAHEEPWGDLYGSMLQSVTLFGDDLPEFPFAVRHRLSREGAMETLWVSCAYGDAAGPGDDLIVAVGDDWDKALNLTELAHIQ